MNIHERIAYLMLELLKIGRRFSKSNAACLKQWEIALEIIELKKELKRKQSEN